MSWQHSPHRRGALLNLIAPTILSAPEPYVTDMAQTSKLREVRAHFLNMDAPPASTLVQVKLGGKWRLEIEAIAVVPD